MKKLLLFIFILSGLQTAFMAQDQYRSAVTTGTWSATATWEKSTDGGSNWAAAATVPGNAASDIVLIRNSHTITVNQNATIAQLTIGEGTTGILQFENVATVRTLIVTGDVTLADGAQLNHGLSVTVEHQMQIGGNLSVGNAAKISVYNSSTRGVNVTFNKSASGDQTISSSGTPTSVDFQKIILNRGNSADRVHCNISISTKGGNNAFQLTNGIWEQSAGTIILPSSTTGGANWYFGSTTGTFKITGSASAIITSSVTGAGGTGGLTGTMTINTSGTVTVGYFNGGANRFENSGNLNIIAGTVYVNGRFTSSSGTTTISGGTIIIDQQVTTNLGATSNAFEVTTSGTLNMSNGTIIIVDPNAATGTGLDIKLSGTVSFTGGTIQLGDGTSTTAGSTDGFEVYLGSGKYLNNFVINNPSGTNRHVYLTDHTTKKDLNVSGNLTITAGELRAYGLDNASANIYLGGSFSNSGTFTPGSTTGFILNGATAQTIGSGFPATVYALTINNASGVALNRDLSITNGLTLTSGIFNLSNNNLTLGSAATVSGSPSAANMIITAGSGELRKSFSAPGSFTFPIGENTATTEYSPIAFTLNSGTLSSAYVTAKAVNAKQGNNNSTTLYLNRYWTLGQSGITDANYNVTATYLPADISMPANEAQLYGGLYTGTWKNLDAVNADLHTINGAGLTAFGDITAGENSVLPVELTSFSGKINGNNIMLQWSTASEINTDMFVIERKISTGNDWKQVGEVKAAGNSSVVREYVFNEKLQSVGMYDYRLRMIDNDGTFEYSKSISIENSKPVNYLLEQNYPNPFNPSTTISYQLADDGKVVIELFNGIGQKISEVVNKQQAAGYYSAKVSGNGLSSGIYFYKIAITSLNGKQTFSSVKKMILAK